LLEIESECQEQWKADRVYEVNAEDVDGEKFFCNFTYPYMNGRLHLGHSFSLSKADFAARYNRAKGRKVLFPFGYHCTGMPIKAAADKLKKEMDTFGYPPVFPEAGGSAAATTQVKHSKVAVKTGGAKYQWEIMKSIGVPEAEIPKFAQPAYWMTYFPPACHEDVERFGLHVDWRRSFITTDANPFYDAFIRWQFNRLRAQDKIRFGKRYTIFSPLDAQPCLDHDRQSGEGVDPKEYVNIKLHLQASPEFLTKFPDLKEKAVFLLAGTLRPETMFGQTNCWVGPEIEYGAFATNEAEFEVEGGEVYICTARAALNMSYQGILPAQAKSIVKLLGSDLIGEFVKAPLAIAYESIPVLPMMTVAAGKGTGIVTSVPSNSPDDFAALRDLCEKEALRLKFGLKEEQVLPFKAISIISSPNLGDFAAERACADANIRSQNDRVALEKAKELCYKEDFYSGVMKVGDQAGLAVSEAKPIIREQMLAAGQAFIYFEPENTVISRSGDECVVALTDQWFIAYGEEQWRDQVHECLQSMELFSPEARNQFTAAVDWMQQWACSRSFGLGSRLPWDPQYLIESLSDSTAYMAYYCVAHILHEGSLDGSTRPASVTPDQMTDAVWDFVFDNRDDLEAVSAESGISQDLLKKMRAEFVAFYPFDLRVSGKDLIPNHMIFCLYNHVALFKRKYWPRAMRCNGHLLLNSAKMSKSTGNFMTLYESCTEFSADATRIALADAGDGLEDANFLKDTANAAILRLTLLLDFAKEVFAPSATWRSGPLLWADCVFGAEIDRSIAEADEAYGKSNYRDAVKAAFFELSNARDRYRDVTTLHGSCGMHAELLKRFVRCQVQLMAPITPHCSEHVWKRICGEGKSILLSPWPSMSCAQIDEALLQSSAYLHRVAHELRTTLASEKIPADSAEIYVAVGYPKWQEAALGILSERYNFQENSFGPDDKLVAALKPLTAARANKKLVPFVMELKKRVLAVGADASLSPEAKRAAIERFLAPQPDTTRQFGQPEPQLLTANLEYLMASLNLSGEISIKTVWGEGFDEEAAAAGAEVDAAAVKRKIEASNPGAPSVRFYKNSA
jgi:leucyl-tRNA synthetase